MPSAPRELFIVYESAHAEEARGRADAGATIVCLHFLLERELTSRGIPFVPLPEIVDLVKKEGEWLLRSHEISREWYRIHAMGFFAYKGIHLAEAPEPVMQAYLSRLFYYVLIYMGIKEKYPGARVVIPEPAALGESAASICLAPFVRWAVVDAARVARLDYAARGSRAVPEYAPPQITRKWLALRLLNALVGLFPRRGVRVYASEYWTHLAPVVPYLKDTELMLLESRQVFRIPWRIILAHRIRVFLSHDVMSAKERRAVKGICAEFAKHWKTAKKDVATYLNSVDGGLDWSPVVEACDYLIAYAPRVVADMRTLERAMRSEKPDLVLQMASVGGPEHYFFLMAKTARLRGIPSLELEHATATTDPRSVFCRIETDYLATYGEDVNRWHEKIGHARKRLIAVGSPRFDRYVNDRAAGVAEGKRLFGTLGLDPSRPVFFVSVPFSEQYVGTPDSYQLADFFSAMRDVQKRVPGLQILFKFRSRAHVGEMREYLRDLFPADQASAADEDIFALLCASDAALCNNSTVIYQAVLARKPLILYPWKHFDSYHAQVYSTEIPLFYDAREAVESAARAFTDPAYRDDLLKRQERFLSRYSFDGHSSERVAALVRNIVQKKPT